MCIDLFWKCQRGVSHSCSLEVKAPQIRVSACETMVCSASKKTLLRSQINAALLCLEKIFTWEWQ